MSEDAGPGRCRLDSQKFKLFTLLTFLLSGNVVYAQTAGSEDFDPGKLASQIFVIILLTAINAFFSAAEMAMVSVNKNRLDEQAEDGDKKARMILDVLSDQSRFLSTIQVCITLAGFFNSASAATGIGQLLGGILASFGIPYAEGISTFVITIILSYITIVFGELVPKRVALHSSEKFAKAGIGVIAFFSKFLRFFVNLLSMSTNAVLRILGIPIEGVEEKVTIEEIRSLVQVGQDQGVINPVESEMIHSVIEFDDKYAEEIMTARTEVFMIDATEPLSDYIDEMLTLKYSRIPVYEEEVDDIIGVLYIKDYMLEAYKVGFDNVDVRKIMRPAYFVPERKNINELFNELQTNHRHMALLIDEYGGFSGLVTMEDLIEEIVGDIDDEYDHDEPELRKIDDHHYVAKGSISIKELNSKIGTDIDEETDDYDTLGGLIIFELGYIPGDGDQPTVLLDHLKFKVEKIEDKRVQIVRIFIRPVENQAEEGENQ